MGDPTDTIIQGVRELMFRAAIANRDAPLPVPITSQGDKRVSGLLDRLSLHAAWGRGDRS